MIKRGRLFRRPDESAKTQTVATADISSGYRLLLGRDPDPAGLEFWGSQVGKMAVEDFVGAIMDAREFHLGPYFKRLAHDVEVTTVQLGDHVLLVDPVGHFVGRAIAQAGAYEPNLTATIRDTLVPGATFVDVGANIGWHSMMAAARVGDDGFVLAFEADPANAELLLRSSRANHCSNVLALAVALSDRPGMAILQQAEGSNAVLYVSDHGAAPGDHLVSTVPLDTFEELLSRLDVMKVDVEGAETLVLKGATRLVDKYRPLIFLEFSPGMLERLPGASADELAAWLADRRYELAIVPSEGAVIPIGSLVDAGDYMRSNQKEHIDLKASPT